MSLLRLSPLVAFVEDRRRSTAGVAHRLSGHTLGISPDLAELLRALREEAVDPAELGAVAEVRQTFEVLAALRFLVPADDPESLLRPFLGDLLVRPWMNPALTFCEGGETRLLRLRSSHWCRLPRTAAPPELVEETVPESAAALLRHADGAGTLGDALAGFERGSRPALAALWEAVDFLTRPERQALRAVPAGTDLASPRIPAHWLQQSFEAAEITGTGESGDGGDTGAEVNALPFYKADIGEARWNFDWVEPTLSHAFRQPTTALGGQAYGERLCDALLNLLGRRKRSGPLRILEIGGGVGFFARSFLGRARERTAGAAGDLGVEYTLLDTSPTLQERQQATLAEAGLPVRFVLGNAEALSFPGERFDVIVANEVIADLTIRRAAAPEGRVQSGSLALLDGIAAHLAAGGVACLTEYGDLDAPPELVEHLNHSEHSVHFAPLLAHAEGLGLRPTLRDLAALLAVREETAMLCGQQERMLCLGHLLARAGEEVPYAAFCRPTFEARFGSLATRLEIGGLAFAPLRSGLHFGPAFHPFRALLLQR